MNWLGELAADRLVAEGQKQDLEQSIHRWEKQYKNLRKYREQIQLEIQKKKELVCQIDTALGTLRASRYEASQALGPLERTIDFTMKLQKVGRYLDLLAFPSDIRVLIFEFLLIEDGPIKLPRQHYAPERSLALFLVCKPIYSEACSVFYRLNTFEITPGPIRSTYKSVSFEPPHPTFLRHVKLHIDKDIKIADILEQLKLYKGLTTLAIIIHSAPSHRKSYKPEALKHLTYKKPPMLENITVETVHSKLPQSDHGKKALESCCEILLEVLKNGKYSRKDVYQRSLRKRKRESDVDTSLL